MTVPADLVVQFQDAFAHFDRLNCGIIPTKLLGQVLRFVGENPSEAEIQDMMNEVDASSTGSFRFPSFLVMMARKYDDNSAEDEIREAFKVFDSDVYLLFTRIKQEWPGGHKVAPDGNGFINRQELRYVMMNLGENMEEEDKTVVAGRFTFLANGDRMFDR
ncbi:neo-calmodulin isoform X2 [Eurytemora carolleeae]|uniref:neo-calmodulin isoform X2 n=1 Tax=Eurytemora carolleeae TaxID=1294199 RepID=UPI000C77EF18|nr:neo-calmodulin isoform X2 [Eurytemora carolleeae]|eukprot:XP_023330203.1 neo-calmodulin-like isoform X2 [Eurytemora affinis]